MFHRVIITAGIICTCSEQEISSFPSYWPCWGHVDDIAVTSTKYYRNTANALHKGLFTAIAGRIVILIKCLLIGIYQVQYLYIMYLIDNCIILNMRVMHSYAHYDDYVYICILWNLLKSRMSYVTVCINDLCDTE